MGEGSKNVEFWNVLKWVAANLKQTVPSIGCYTGEPHGNRKAKTQHKYRKGSGKGT